MTQKIPQPGISREDRLSNEGLRRLEAHLKNGSAMSEQVLAQWIKRYGDPAREIIKEHGKYRADFDTL